MGNKIIINDNVMASVLDSDYSINEALTKVYYDEIQDRRAKVPELYKDMTPVQMAYLDAGVTKKTVLGDIMNQGTITTQGAGEWLLPVMIDTTLKEYVKSDDILPYIVSTTQTETARNVDVAYLDMTDPSNKENVKKSRVAEGADLPLAKIKIGEHSIRLFKYGRAVEETYEAMRELRVDMLQKTLFHIAKDTAKQESADAAMVALDGDGNNNPAAKLGETSGSGVITQEELIDYLIDYSETTGMTPTTIIANKKVYKQLVKMVYNTNTAFGANAKFAINAPQIGGDTLTVILSDIPQKSSKDIGIILNKDMSLTKHILNGSKISEYAGNIRNQTKLGTISEISGFSKSFPDGVMYFAVK